MAAHDDGLFGTGGDAVNVGDAGARDARLVGESGHAQAARRVGLVGVVAHGGGVVDGAVKALGQRVVAHGAGDAVHGGRRAGHHHGGGCGGVEVGAVVDILKHHAFGEEAVEAALHELGAQQVDILLLEAVDHDAHNQFGLAGIDGYGYHRGQQDRDERAAADDGCRTAQGLWLCLMFFSFCQFYCRFAACACD